MILLKELYQDTDKGSILKWHGQRIGLKYLAKLWAEGLSASQIAKELGEVTRNAVIGKVHRLGLSGRAKPSNPTKKPTRKTTAARTRAAKDAFRHQESNDQQFLFLHHRLQ